MQAFIIPNLTEQEVGFGEVPATGSLSERPATKAQFTQRSISPQTQDCFISMFAGENAAARVNQDNPAAFLHGIVADYDTPLTNEQRQKMLARLTRKPAYVSASYSGGTHAVWLFAKPLPLIKDSRYLKALLACIARELHLGNAFGALDENAYYAPSQFYHIGWDLQEAGGEPIGEEHTLLWQEEAMNKANWKRVGTVVPLERVAEEVERQYPGRWSGPFTENARGVRFWDPDADNATSAVVKPSGMLCYTGSVPFMTWADIFGPDFCSDVESEGRGSALRDGYCVGNQFWFKSPMSGSGKNVTCWVSYNRQNAEALLTSRYGLNAVATAPGKLSQVKETMAQLVNQKSLCGVMPGIYGEGDTIEYDGRVFLNISTVQAMKPAKVDHAPAWGEGFPWISGFLEGLLGDVQLQYFLSWLSRAYRGAVDHNPQRGQAIYIAGPSGTGKSLLSAQILAPLLGGRQEAVDYLTGATRFNRELFTSGLWFIDDATPITEPKAHRKYSAMMKKMVANSTFNFEAKYVEAVKLPWMGRLVVTCNDDPESLRILPQIDINNKDKLMFFHTTADPLTEKEPERRIKPELGAFAAYLYDYEIPEECIGGNRFGVASFLHPDLYAEAEDSGPGGIFRDLMDSFLKNYFGGEDGEREDLHGSALHIYELMALDPSVKPAMEGLVDSGNIGMRLGQLAARENYPVKRERGTKGARGWVVKRDDFYSYLDEA